MYPVSGEKVFKSSAVSRKKPEGYHCLFSKSCFVGQHLYHFSYYSCSRGGVIAKCIQHQVKKVIDSSAVLRTKNLKDITICLAKAASLVNIFIISLLLL